MSNKVYIQVGCGPSYPEGFINTDKDTLDITKPWPYEDESVDGITSMHVLVELGWRELVFAFREMHRVLKKDGVLRMGVPYLESGLELDWLLGWGNIQLFTEDQLKRVLHGIGFEAVVRCGYGLTASQHDKIVTADNRKGETLFLEAFKKKPYE